MKRDPAPFASEADLCRVFISLMPPGWTAYPETGGFDILLRHDVDGFQIGVEAKLRLNAKVICQAAEYVGHSYVDQAGPDCRAVLIPDGVSTELAGLCPLLGITVIKLQPERDLSVASFRLVQPPRFKPDLPSLKNPFSESPWHELCPVERITLPDWVPDVSAGNSAPIALTDWKIRAIKIVVLLKRNGFVTRKDFAAIAISMSRWTQEKWLVKGTRNQWVAGPKLPDFKKQHPVNYPQIEANYEKWAPKESVA